MRKKALIAYFSASGVTARAAREMATATGADLYEIRPQQPYTHSDLDWTVKTSRSTLEKVLDKTLDAHGIQNFIIYIQTPRHCPAAVLHGRI